MTATTARPRKSLPVEHWPAVDRAAWDALFAAGDIVIGDGPARHWRPATRTSNLKSYARWLGWLRAEGILEPADAPEARVTPERVEAYGRHLVSTVAQRTTATYLIGLKCVIKAIAPGQDWRWLMDLTNRVDVWARPSVDRRAAMRPVTEIHRAARDALDPLLAEPPASERERLAFRDALMVLVLSACPLRIANFAALRIGVDFVREAERWILRISGAETKNRRPLAFVLPAHATVYIDAYVQKIRPSFGPAQDCDALWVGVRRKPISQHTIYVAIKTVTERLLGTAITPHLFRSCAATTLVEDAPGVAWLAAPLLGHDRFSTTEGFYIKADELTASRRINALLSDIANGDDEEV